MNEWSNLFLIFLLIFVLCSIIYFYFHRLQEKQIMEKFEENREKINEEYFNFKQISFINKRTRKDTYLSY